MLHRFDVLDTEPEEVFDGLTAIAAQLCDAPMAAISLVDTDRQWFKARIGFSFAETDRSTAFAAVALLRPELLEIPDTTSDPRFADNPLVVGDPGIRFYAGAPLIAAGGHVLGTLEVQDRRPRTLTDLQRSQLTLLAGQVVAQLTLRRQAGEVALRSGSSEHALDADADDRLLRGLLAHPETAVYAKDLKGRYLLANDTTRRLFSVPDGSPLGLTDHQLLSAGAADAIRNADLRVAEHGAELLLTEQIEQRDGSVREYRSTKFPLRDRDGTVYAVAGISTDVTARAEAASKLVNSELRWRQLFDESPVGIGLSDERGLFVAANPALCALYVDPNPR